MRISGWHIDGFGTFENHAVGHVQPGLTVFSGPNEAGKSTLLAFIREMLFGMKGTARKRSYSPTRGGNHGGRLFLDSADGAHVVVERHALNRGAARITVDGNPRSEHDLQALLGGCDEDVFRSVFAFGLSELQKMDSLDRGAIGERIFSAGVVGAGRSAHAVLKDLGERKAKLLKQTHGRARINDLVRAIDAKSAEIAEAARTISTHDDLNRRIADADTSITHYGEELERIRATRDRYKLLESLWPTWHERREAAAAVSTINVDERLHLFGADVDDLVRNLPRYRDWQERHQSAEGKRLAAERALTEQLRDLGPEWNRTALTAFDRSIPRTEEVHGHATVIAERRAARDAAEADARTAAETASTAARIAAESAAIVSELPTPPTREDLDQRADTVRSLRALNADLAAVETRADAAATNVAAIERTRPKTPLSDPFSGTTVGYGLGLAAAVLLGMAVWQGLTGAISVAIVLGLLSVGLAYFAVVSIRRAAPLRAELENAQQTFTTSLAIAKSEHAGFVARAEELRTAIASGAARLGLEANPTNHDIEAADRRVSQHEADFRVYVQATRDAARDAEAAKDRRDDAAAAKRRADDATAAFQEVVTAWDTWKRGAGVPLELSPQGVLAFFDRVRVGRDLLLNLEDAERESTAAALQIEGFETRANQVLTSGGRSIDPADEIGEAILALSRAVAEERHRRATIAELQQTISRCDRMITDALGEGESAQAIREELPRGDLEIWRAEVSAATDAISTLGAERDAAIETRAKAIRDREEIEASSDIARMELEHAAAKEELRIALHEWQVIALAEGLIQETLHRFERERQPEVLQNASRLFSVITEGEYTRLYRPIGDVAGLSITTRRESLVRPEDLSQGTREQLYLCIRLGLAADHASRTSSIPLVMDDVLVNFDPGRARAVAEVLCEFSQDHQVLLFTCHPHTVELLRSIQPTCGHFAMQRYGAGGDWVERPGQMPAEERELAASIG